MSEFILFALMTAAHGRDANSPVDAIEAAQGAATHAATPPCANCDLTRTGREEPDWPKCLSEICPEGAGTLDKAADHAAAAWNPQAEKEFSAAFHGAAKALLKARLNDIDAIQAAILTDRKLTDPAARRLAKFTQLLQVAPEVKAVGEKGLQITPNAMSARDRASQAAFFPRLRLLSEKFPEKGDYAFLVENKSALEIASLAQRHLDSLRKTNARIAAKTRIHENIPTGTPLEAEINGLQIGSESYDTLMRNLHVVKVTEAIVTNTDFDREGETISVREYFGHLSPALARTADLMRKHLDDKRLGSGKGDEIDQKFYQAWQDCAAGFANNREFAPNEAQIEAFNTGLPAFRRRYAESFKGHLSAQSSATLERLVETWQPAVPPTATEQNRAFIDGLERFEKAMDGLPEVRAQGAKANADYVVAKQITFVPTLVKDPVEELAGVCARHSIRPVRDAALLGRDRFEVGPLSVTNPAFGKMVLRHEFSHLLSDYMRRGKMSAHSKNWFDGVRSCLSRAPGSAERVEEDWADFGSEFDQGPPPACHFMHLEPRTLTLKGRPNDPHSSDLRRILQHHFMAGRPVPESCVSALATKGEKFVGVCRDRAQMASK